MAAPTLKPLGRPPTFKEWKARRKGSVPWWLYWLGLLAFWNW